MLILIILIYMQHQLQSARTQSPFPSLHGHFLNLVVRLDCFVCLFAARKNQEPAWKSGAFSCKIPLLVIYTWSGAGKFCISYLYLWYYLPLRQILPSLQNWKHNMEKRCSWRWLVKLRLHLQSRRNFIKKRALPLVLPAASITAFNI